MLVSLTFKGFCNKNIQIRAQSRFHNDQNQFFFMCMHGVLINDICVDFSLTSFINLMLKQNQHALSFKPS